MSNRQIQQAANSEETLKELVGSKIIGALREGANLYLVLDNEQSFVLTSLGGETTPAFWIASRSDTARVINKRRKEIEEHIKQLGELTQLP